MWGWDVIRSPRTACGVDLAFQSKPPPQANREHSDSLRAGCIVGYFDLVGGSIAEAMGRGDRGNSIGRCIGPTPTEHYHLERLHQSHENVVISDFKNKQKKPSLDSPTIELTEIRCQERLGGLLKHYSKRAA